MANNVILPQLQRQPTGLEQFSTGLGNSVGAGIQNLLQLKTQQLQQRHGLEALGYTPKEASGLSNLSPESLREVIKQKIQQPSQQAYLESLQSLLGTPSQQAQPESLQQLLGQAQQQPQQVEGLQNQAQQASSILGKPGLNERQATKLAELGLKKQEIAKKERSEAFKETKKFREEISKSTKAARETLHDLDRLEELEKEGKLDTPGYIEGLKNANLDIPALLNEGSQEYNKVVGGFIKNAKNIYGSRISNFELENFLKILPNLSQSPEGRKRVLANLKHTNRAALAYNDAMKEILKENKGIPPLDLQEQIDDRIGPKLDKLAGKFKEDLAKPVPPGQGRIATAIQALIGKAAGSIGKAALKSAGSLGQAALELL